MTEHPTTLTSIAQKVLCEFELVTMTDTEKATYSAKEAHDRHSTLLSVLSEKNMQLRDDSDLYRRYLEGESEYSLASIIKRMQLMDFMHSHTPYPFLLNKKYRYARDIPLWASNAQLRVVALREYMYKNRLRDADELIRRIMA